MPESQEMVGTPLKLVRKAVRKLIEADHPDLDSNDNISDEDLTKYRMQYLERMMHQEQGKLSTIQQEVLQSIQQQELISESDDELYQAQFTLGEKLADGIAKFGGSWGFIISFATFLIIWITINTIALFTQPFDPYPYILLNLLLSCLAAIQAPIIMMSQNRQEAKDRLRAKNDYKVNLKSEIEIRTLHEKIDHVLVDQWRKMGQIQQLQLEMIAEIKNQLSTQQKS